MSVIRESYGCISFESLIAASRLDVVGLSSVIGVLLKEKQIGLYASNNVEGIGNYKPRIEVLFKEFMESF